MDRWEYASKEQEDETPVENLNKCIDFELTKLSNYTAKKFGDPKLQEKAISYINILNESKEALTYYTVDYAKYMDLWENTYKKRSQAIADFILTYELSFPEKYKKTADEFLSNAKIINENNQLAEKVNSMISAVTFSQIDASGSYVTYEGILENTTDKTFDYFSTDINLLDADGIIIETEYCHLSNIKPGQKAKLEFSTDKKFTSYEITPDYSVAD